MKSAILLGAAGLAALSLAACSKPASTTADNASTAASDAASSGGAAVNKAEDATGAAVGAASANTMGSVDTGSFVSNASQSDMYEIQAGKIAQTRAKASDVKAFAKMMVADHTAMSKEMQPLIAAAGQTPATALDNRRSGFIDHLNQASDADFDKTYIDQQVAGHQEALDLMKGYADKGSDAGLKAEAAKAAPKVQTHLDKAKAIQAKLSSSTKP